MLSVNGDMASGRECDIPGEFGTSRGTVGRWGIYNEGDAVLHVEDGADSHFAAGEGPEDRCRRRDRW